MISWILTGCPEMQWSSTGYGIEIRDISAVSPSFFSFSHQIMPVTRVELIVVLPKWSVSLPPSRRCVLREDES
jgi:hypothetical protein